MCPIQPNFLLFISTFMSDCSVLSHSSWLEIISGHQIPSIFRRHLLTKACSFCVILSVTNHVSQPYSRTDLTHALNNLILRCSLIFFALQIFSNLENAPCTVQNSILKKIPETSNAPIQDTLKCPRYENKLPGKLISESWGGYLLLMVYTHI